MRNISVLIKPASGKCNLRCKYCFYHDVIDNRQIKDYGMISVECTENLIKKAIDYAKNGFCTFAFQGGEPILRGLDYFNKFIDLVNRYNRNNTKVNYVIQTNGILIDEKWAKFFANNDFLVGLSLDGTKDVNDINRVDARGEGTYTKIIKTSKLLKKYNAQYNILTVVNKSNASKIRSIYNFYKRNNFKYMQYIPCLDPVGDKHGTKQYSLTPERYEQFLKALFDLWYNDIKTNNIISIRFFDNILSMISGRVPESCDMKGYCSIQNVIESDGSVYPCDFYVIDGYKLGNINNNTFEEIHSSYAAKNFINSSMKLNYNCKDCKWISLCRGGCRRYREIEDKSESYRNYYCKAFYNFYEYSYCRFMELAQMIRYSQLKKNSIHRSALI